MYYVSTNSYLFWDTPKTQQSSSRIKKLLFLTCELLRQTTLSSKFYVKSKSKSVDSNYMKRIGLNLKIIHFTMKPTLPVLGNELNLKIVE